MSETVDSSPEAIAEMLRQLRAPMWIVEPIDIQKLVEHCAALLAQVTRERDEARALREQMRVDRFHECESVRAEAKAAIAAAERQLAEARAALQWYGEKAESLARYMAGNDRSQWKLGAVEAVLTELSLDAGQRKARALLSGETTRGEDDQ